MDVDDAGNAVAIWLQDRGSYREVQVSVRPASTGVWEPPTDLAVPGLNAFGQVISVNARGDAIALWQQNDELPPILHSSFRPSGGVWQPAQQVSPSWEDALWPDVAIHDAGNAIAVWTQGYDGVKAAHRPFASGAWEGPATISEAGQEERGQTSSSMKQGTLWRSGSTVRGALVVRTSRFPTGGGAWEPAQNLSAPNTAIGYEPDLAITPSGMAIAVWTGSAWSVERVDAAVKPAGTSTWNPAETISSQGTRASWPNVAVDEAGDAVSAWNKGFDTESVVQAAGFDGAGPVLGDLSIPDSGEPGLPASFSVSPFDVWSLVAGPATWAFGDGGSASGNQVDHTYSTAGSYLVTVRAQDTLQNEAGPLGDDRHRDSTSATTTSASTTATAATAASAASTSTTTGQVRRAEGRRDEASHRGPNTESALHRRSRAAEPLEARRARDRAEPAARCSATRRGARETRGRKALSP